MKNVAALLALTVVAIACSSSGVEPGSTTSAHCYERRVRDAPSPVCECTTKEDARSAADFEKVATCVEVDRGFCCSDVDTNGEAKTCRCYVADCFFDRTTNKCGCGNGYDGSFSLDISDAERVSSCDDVSGVRCCGRTDDSTACWCSPDLDDTCENDPRAAPVATCRASDQIPKSCARETLTTSCQDIRFKPPPPPSTGGGGGDEDECKYDGDCSSDCSTDCYGCRSGRCRCGHRGVSGGCLL